MRARLCAVGIVALVALAALVRPAAAAFGPSVRITSELPLAERLDKVAASPEGAFYVAGSSPLELASRDGGATWRALTGAPNPSVCVAVDGADTLLRLDSMGGGGFGFSRSTDGGASWTTTPLQTTSYLCRIEVASSGTIAIANSPEVLLSTDDGASFTSRATFPWPALGLEWSSPTDLIVCGVPWPTPETRCARSTDGGLTFGSEERVLTGTGDYRQVALAVRGGSELVIVYQDGPDLASIRSLDHGATWTAPSVMVSGASFPLAEGVSPISGGVSSRLWILTTGGLYASDDGVTAFPVPSPPGCDTDWYGRYLDSPEWNRIFAGRTANEALYWSDALWRTSDGGASWLLQAPPPVWWRKPLQSTVALRLADGRLAAIASRTWAADRPLWSSVSSDEGGTWSPELAINDTFIAAGDTYEQSAQREIAAVALPGGGAAVLYLAEPTGGRCGEVRIARSSDLAAWEPSQVLAVDAEGPLGLAVDGAARVVALWSEGLERVTSTSLDEARTFARNAATLPDPAALPVADEYSSALVTAPDGALVTTAQSPVVGMDAFRSLDGGASWIASGASVLQWDCYYPSIVRAGSMLYISGLWEFDGALLPRLLRSSDSGRTWVESNPPDRCNAPFGCGGAPHRPVALLGGDSAGHAYAAFDRTLLRLAPDGTYAVVGASPQGAAASEPAFAYGPVMSVVPLATGELGLLWGEWSLSGDPGVWFTAFRPETAIQRDDSIRALDPRPDVGALYPLAPYAALAAALSGVLDPDASVLADATRPLVLYGLGDGAAGVLKVTKSAGSVRLDW